MTSPAPAFHTRRDVLAGTVTLMASGICTLAQAQTRNFPLPHRPEDVQPYFAQTFNAGDLDAVMKMYAADGIFIPKPGVILTGHDAIRAATAEFMSLKLPFNLKQKQVLLSGDTALLISDWVIEGKGPDGKPMKLTGTTADVARRQTDGVWLVLIDNPFGTISA